MLAVASEPSKPRHEGQWSCMHKIYGCSDTAAINFMSYVTDDWPSMCQFGGCNDTEAKNFDSVVSTDPQQPPRHSRQDRRVCPGGG